MRSSSAFPLLVALLLPACGGTVVFDEQGAGGAGTGGANGDGATTNGTASATATSGPGGPTGTAIATTVGPVASASSGPGTGICGTGVSLFDGSGDACVEGACCDLFQQCALFGDDPGGCDLCIAQGGGPRCADALRCAKENDCFTGAAVCGETRITGDPVLDGCLLDACCLDALVCTQGGTDAGPCVECLQFGGGPQCNDLLLCGNQQGCFVQQGSR